MKRQEKSTAKGYYVEGQTFIEEFAKPVDVETRFGCGGCERELTDSRDLTRGYCMFCWREVQEGERGGREW